MSQRDERHDDPADDPHEAPPGPRARHRRAPRSKAHRRRVNAEDLMRDMLTGETLEPRIRHLREERELTFAETARKASEADGRTLAASRISDWETGHAPVPLNWLPALAVALDTPLEELAVAAIRTNYQQTHHG